MPMELSATTPHATMWNGTRDAPIDADWLSAVGFAGPGPNGSYALGDLTITPASDCRGECWTYGTPADPPDGLRFRGHLCRRATNRYHLRTLVPRHKG